MEYGEERGWWERTGDRIYEKEEWKRIPTERFKTYVGMTTNIVSPDLSAEQREWLISHVMDIPSYENYNPFAFVLGYLTLDLDKKQVNDKKFKRIADKYSKQLQTPPSSILRYARKWQSDWLQLLS